MGGSKDEHLFSVVPIEWTRGNEYKPKYRNSHLNTRKSLIYSEVGQTAEQVSHRGCGVSVAGDPQA